MIMLTQQVGAFFAMFGGFRFLLSFFFRVFGAWRRRQFSFIFLFGYFLRLMKYMFMSTDAAKMWMNPLKELDLGPEFTLVRRRSI
jgi:hypothetical protein